MKLSGYFGRWTTTKASVAVAGSLAIAGAIGSAVAMSPIVTPPIKWQGGAAFNTVTSAGNFVKAFTVPAGRNFLLTDLTASNFAAASTYFHIYVGGESCGNTNPVFLRLNSLIVPPANNTVLALQTGIGFSTGQSVCIFSPANVVINARGFLFTPN